MNSIYIVIPILTALMFSLGLSLTLHDFTEVVRRPKPVILGLIGQLVVLPAAAFAIGEFFRLSPTLYVGLVLIACCPGGSSSNVFSKLANGDVPLSVTLTALSSVITLFTIPFVLSLATSKDGISLPIGTLLMQNVVMVLLPVAVGMLMKHYLPAVAAKCDKVLSRLAFPGLVTLATIYFLQNKQIIVENINILGSSVLSLILFSIIFGAVLAAVFGLQRQQQRTIVIEVGMQNAAQAIAIAASPLVFNEEAYAVPAIVYALFMNLVLLAYVIVIRKGKTEIL